MAAKVQREVVAVDNDVSPGCQAGESAIPSTRGGKRRQGSRSPGNECRPSLPAPDSLFTNLQGIANREATRLCSNLSSRLTPEMAVAVFKGLSLQVDALLASPIIAGCPVRGFPASSETAMDDSA